MENEEKKTEVEYVDLHNEAALALALASERVASARAALELRERDLRDVLKSVSSEYQEDGKYQITELNVDKRKVGRVKV